MGRRKSHAETIYLVRRDNLPTINFTLRDNERAAPGYYLDPQDPETWRPVDTTGKNFTGWFKAMCDNGPNSILFGIPVLRHAPYESGKLTMLGSPSVLMNIPPGWYEIEVESHVCATSYKQTVWKRFKFCVRQEFDSIETDGMNAPIYRDADGVLQELPVNPPFCSAVEPYYYHVDKGTTTYTVSGTASDPDGTIDHVDYRLNGGTWFTANLWLSSSPGIINWDAVVNGLVVGENIIEVRSVDNEGSCSVLLDCYVYRGSNQPPTLHLDCGEPNPVELPNECFVGIDRTIDGVTPVEDGVEVS